MRIITLRSFGGTICIVSAVALLNALLIINPKAEPLNVLFVTLILIGGAGLYVTGAICLFLKKSLFEKGWPRTLFIVFGLMLGIAIGCLGWHSLVSH